MMTDPELQALAKLVADELETRAKAKAAEAVAKSQSFVPGPPTPSTTELAIRNLRMSREAMQPMLDAVSDGLLRQVSRDQFAKAPASMIPEREGLPPADPNPNQVNTTGYRNPRPLKSGLQT
jgi:hypothetical protein